MSETAVAEKSAPSEESNIKEMIESILIAFILAFIFRAFVVEAFVIPTGSMAPTLMGAHMRFTCPDCGYRFEVNFPTDPDADESMLVPRNARIERPNEDPIDRVYSVYCPNCGFKLPRHDEVDPNNSVTAPPVRYGDRILVLKYLYLFQDPRRWDVVVFKAPPEPIHYDYSINYIKRLTGKPGESIMIMDGDVYVAEPGTSGTNIHDFVVQTKPRSVQDALWRIVYDNDFYPQGLSRAVKDAHGQIEHIDPQWQQPWTPQPGGRGWDLGSSAAAGRTFKFNALDGEGAIEFNADANRTKFALTDWLAYDQISGRSMYPADLFDEPQSQPDNNVSDLKLGFTYHHLAGNGSVKAELSKLGRNFVAELFPDHVALYSTENGDRRELGTAQISLEKGLHHVELTNVDYQVTVRIDGRDLIQTTPEQYAPHLDKLLEAFYKETTLPRPTIRIDASAQSCELSHLGLWRDVYYGNRPGRGSSAPTFHASPKNFPDNIMHLGKDEYFVLGDNSLISGDARYWDNRIELPAEGLDVDSGRVPGRFLLGKAFFVYWPAGFRPFDAAPALVPDFGDMRMIH